MKLKESNTNFIDDFFPNTVPPEVQVNFIKNTEDKFVVCDYESTGRRFIFSGTLLKTDLNNTINPGVTVFFRKCDCKLVTTKTNQVLKYKDSNMLYVVKVFNDVNDPPTDVENETKYGGLKEDNENGTKTNSRTSKYSRVKSFVYANIDFINDLDNFKRLRIIEFEDEKGYSYQLRSALDYAYMLVTTKKYDFGPIVACKEAAKKYHLSYKDVHAGNQGRKNIRSTCNKLWIKAGKSE